MRSREVHHKAYNRRGTCHDTDYHLRETPPVARVNRRTTIEEVELPRNRPPSP